MYSMNISDIWVDFISPQMRWMSCHIDYSIQYNWCQVILRAIDGYMRHTILATKPKQNCFGKYFGIFFM